MGATHAKTHTAPPSATEGVTTPPQARRRSRGPTVRRRMYIQWILSCPSRRGRTFYGHQSQTSNLEGRVDIGVAL
eukprot:scaffold1233_cov395-Prasinococcus_capsulatus_cf.AAC.32